LIVGDPGSHLRAGVETQLVEDLFEVPFRRATRDEESFRYIAIGQPIPYEAWDLQLAGCKSQLELPAHATTPMSV